MEQWPNFFIVGTAKAGTTSLYEYLKEVPGIYMSPVKEPNYFSVNTTPSNLEISPYQDKTKYQDLFRKVKNEKIIGEASPTYLADPDSPKLIHKVSPNAKILISLRDPVERIFSFYLMLVRLGATKLSFHEVIELSLKTEKEGEAPKLLLARGLYFENVKRYIDTFGSDQVKIIIFEEFIKNPRAAVNEILKFLGINYKFEAFDSTVYNPFTIVRGSIAQYFMKNKKIRKISEKFIPKSGRRVLRETLLQKKQSKPKMEGKDIETLRNLYKNDVKKIKDLLGNNIKWKNFPN